VGYPLSHFLTWGAPRSINSCIRQRDPSAPNVGPPPRAPARVQAGASFSALNTSKVHDGRTILYRASSSTAIQADVLPQHALPQDLAMCMKPLVIAQGHWLAPSSAPLAPAAEKG
jgi:hypothetical protein